MGCENPAPLETALSLARRGWPVFPLIPGEKRPAIRDWERRATTDPDRIARCWETGSYNLGVACGRADLVVLDLDTAKPGATRPVEWRIPAVQCGEDALAVLADSRGQPYDALMDTYAVRTGSGGLHLYYRAPAGIELRNTVGLLGWLIDTRAAGGYVVATGSTVASRPYTVLADTRPTPLPAWLTERLTPAGDTNSSGDNRLDALLAHLDCRVGYANAALRGEIQRVLDAPQGTRNNTLVRAAFALGQLVAERLLPEPLVQQALLAAGGAVGLPGRECRRTIASGLRSGGRRPRGGAA